MWRVRMVHDHWRMNVNAAWYADSQWTLVTTITDWTHREPTDGLLCRRQHRHLQYELIKSRGKMSIWNRRNQVPHRHFSLRSATNSFWWARLINVCISLSFRNVAGYLCVASGATSIKKQQHHGFRQNEERGWCCWDQLLSKIFNWKICTIPIYVYIYIYIISSEHLLNGTYTL